MKTKILAVSVILTIGASLMAINEFKKKSQIQQGLDQERYNRIVAEEKLDKATAQIASLQSDLDSATSKIQSIQIILEQGKILNSDLKSQLESASRLKESLEKKITDLKNVQTMPQPAPSSQSTQ